MTTKRYEVVRMYGYRRRDCDVIKSDLTLEEAQEHCNDPETSSRTCSEETADKLNIEGIWFDGYREQ